MLKVGTSLLAGALMFAAMACDDGVADRIENSVDCNKICRDFKECAANDSYDTEDCTDECKAESRKSDDFEEKADDCASCLRDGDTCRDDAKDCTVKCASVVAQSQS